MGTGAGCSWDHEGGRARRCARKPTLAVADNDRIGRHSCRRKEGNFDALGERSSWPGQAPSPTCSS